VVKGGGGMRKGHLSDSSCELRWGDILKEHKEIELTCIGSPIRSLPVIPVLGIVRHNSAAESNLALNFLILDI